MTPAAGPRAVTLRTPAKLNLGLEVIGRRPDGFHDLVTIFQAIAVFDQVTLTPAPDLRLTCDDPALSTPDNLALLALARLQARLGSAPGATLHLAKGIPVAAGLGGASSDAAAALLAACRLWKAAVSDDELARLAAALGSDVPFFLRGGTALASGRGERLEALPSPPGVWFVVVSPAVVLPRKTATLYGALTPAAFSTGDNVRAQAERIRAGHQLDAALLGNAFARPLYALRPELAELPGLMRAAGAATVGFSGAGPSHYAALADPEDATRIAAALSDRLGASAKVAVAAALAKPPAPTVT